MAKTIKSRFLLLGGLVLLIVLGFIGWNLNRNEDQVDDPIQATEPTETAEIDETKNSSARSESSSGQSQFLVASLSHRSTFQEIFERAESGDPVAQYSAHKILLECSGLQEASDIEEQINTAHRVGVPYSDAHIEYLWAMHSECKTIPGENVRERAFNYLALAQESNLPAAIAHKLIDIAQESGLESSDEIALQVLMSGDPEAIQNTRPYLAFRYNSLSVEQRARALDRKVVDAALLIWSCNLGWDQCRAGSHLVVMNCFTTPNQNCNPNESLLSHASHAIWTLDTEDKARMLAWEWQQAVQNGETPKIFVGETQ